MILPRVLTAALGIPLAAWLVHLGGAPYLAFVVGAAFLALHEYATILWMSGRGIGRTLTVAGGTLLCLAVALTPALSGRLPALAPMALTALILAALLCELFAVQHSLDRAALGVFGALLIGWTLGHLALVRQIEPHGEALTYLLFTTVWATDILAYCVGSLIGRRRFAQVLSPKKTWEGCAGGLLGAVAAAWLMRQSFLEWMPAAHAVGVGLLAGVVGQVSDLSQSLVKRAAGVKDSGALLPGHGGVFDRMDSLLLLAPIYYYWMGP
jgi:phosphatidate cytidylyltransferase